MNAVIGGYIPYSALKDGSINLYDLFILNEAVQYKSDYEEVSADIYKKLSE